MNKKIIMLIPVFGLFIIPQLLYFWLAPDVACNIVIYCFGTVLTISHLILSYTLAIKREIRVIAGVVTVGTIVWIIDLIAGAILLGVNASVRTSVFSLLIILVAYTICVVTLLCTTEDESISDKDRGSENQNNHISNRPLRENEYIDRTVRPISAQLPDNRNTNSVSERNNTLRRPLPNR